MSSPVAVVIRCLNEVQWIGRVIDAVVSQTIDSEIVVVDSGSTDGTLAEVSARQVQLITIGQRDFTYGRALNRGCEATNAPLIVALSAHALPVDRTWLEQLAAPFQDPLVGGVYGRQLPQPGLDPFRSRHILDYWTEQPAIDTLEHIKFSNANCALRRSLWQEHAFGESLPASEDREWARWALEHGHIVVYVPSAAVFHSHADSPLRWYKRWRAEAQMKGMPPQSWAQVVRRVLGSTKTDLRRLGWRPTQWRWAPLSPLLRTAEALADRAGAMEAERAAQDGSEPS